MARYVLPVAGAIIGFYIGGPQGAMYGWQIGALAGQIADPQTIKGPAVGDLVQQTSQAGVPRPIVFGTSQPIAGNVIATGEPVIVKKKQSQGKGGPKVETESVYRTYAIRVCEGPVDGFLRVWRNNILVYDARPGGDLTTAENAKFLATARFFLGGYDQMPSPDLEAVLGVGFTPAHRGTCYMVMANEDLTDLRGAIPQFQFQVARGRRIPIVSAGVLHPWLGGARNDPRNPLNRYTYTFSAGGAIGAFNEGSTGGDGHCSGVGDTIFGLGTFDSLAEAVTALNGAWGFAKFTDQVIAYSSGANINLGDKFTYPPTSEQEPGPENTDYQRWAWLHLPIGGLEPEYVQGGVLITTYDAHPNGARIFSVTDASAVNDAYPRSFVSQRNSTTLGSTWLIGLRAIVSSSYALTCNQASTLHRAYPCAVARAERLPGMPVPGATLLSGTFKALRAWVNTPGSGTGNPISTPLDPCLALGDDDYNNQAFWEAAYANAVIAGDMAGGLTYGVDYPKIQNEAWFYYDEVAADTIPVVDIIDEICARVGLTQYDASDLEELHTHGLTITNTYPAYAAIQSLGQVFMFDAVNADGQIRFPLRGADSVATITADDYVDDQDLEYETSMRQDTMGVPRVMHLNYFDIDGGLATDKQTSERPNTRRALGESSLSSAVIMNADQAAQVVTIQHKVGIEELRGERKFSLPDSFLTLTVGDNVLAEWNGVYYRLRLTAEETMDGYQQYVGVHDRQSNYTSNVEGIPAVPQTPPPSSVVGPTLIEPLDIHILRDADDAVGIGLVGYVAIAGTTAAWQGATVELSYDGGANYEDESFSVTTSSVMGVLTSALPDHPQAFPDEVNTFEVLINTDDGVLEETDLAGMLNGRNLAIVGDELIQFATPDEVSEGTWEVSYLLRGRKGTEPVAHVIGERFIVLSRAALLALPANLTDIGRTLTFRATSFGAAVGDATVVSMTYTGRSQIEREVGYLAAHRTGSSMVVSWQGVGRLGSGAQAAHGQHFAGYRVTYDDGTNPAVVVDTDDQAHTQDVSALGSPVTISVQQLNDLTGAGPAVEVLIP